MSLSLRKFLRTYLPFVLGAIVGVCLALIIYAIIHNTNQTDSACRAANGIGDGVIAVLKDGQNQAKQTRAETLKEKQRQQAIDFYNKAIKHIQDSKCH